MTYINKKAVGGHQTAHKKNLIHKYCNKNYHYLQIKLPHPFDFYTSFLGTFRKNKNSDWATFRCCFHSPDRHPSLSVNLATGAFHCWSCGAKGGNLIKFYQTLHCVDYKTAIQMLATRR